MPDSRRVGEGCGGILRACCHAGDAGWSGLTYTRDLVEPYDQHEDELWEVPAQDAEDFGCEFLPAFVATFNRADTANTADGFKELCVWYIAEREAQRLRVNRHGGLLFMNACS